VNSTVAELVKSQTDTREMARVAGWFRLLRPANLVTSGADVLTGFLLVDAPRGHLLWPLLASVGLYAGGVVLNDYFDRTLDATERPERPIPSGLISSRSAAVVGFSLLAAAVAVAFLASPLTGVIAIAIVLGVLAYDAGMKHHALGPLVMGSCRGLNLLLGLAAAPALLPHLWFLPLLPLAYISGITLLSRGEVMGGTHRTSAVALILFAGVIVAAAALHLSQPSGLLAMTPFLLLLVVKAGVPLWRAYRHPYATYIRGGVHAGVVSLIVLDAALAAGHAGVILGAAILSLSVIAGELAKLFPVT
jgi:4-hydroxybenzoate polyprenyltransferase